MWIKIKTRHIIPVIFLVYTFLKNLFFFPPNAMNCCQHRCNFNVCICFYLQDLVSCGDPGSPLNGQKLGSRYWAGKTVSFICHPGYRLIGPATRMCLASGDWSGIEPSCTWRNSAICYCYSFPGNILPRRLLLHVLEAVKFKFVVALYSDI